MQCAFDSMRLPVQRPYQSKFQKLRNTQLLQRLHFIILLLAVLVPPHDLQLPLSCGDGIMSFIDTNDTLVAPEN